jgi:hypothetical protein
MLDDAVIVNVESIRDNDRLTLVIANSILSDSSKPDTTTTPKPPQ